MNLTPLYVMDRMMVGIFFMCSVDFCRNMGWAEGVVSARSGRAQVVIAGIPWLAVLVRASHLPTLPFPSSCYVYGCFVCACHVPAWYLWRQTEGMGSSWDRSHGWL